jgi:hypothetical protein
MSDSAFDRPVTHLVVGANPWPFARELMDHGCEVTDSDLVPDDQLYVIDLAAIDEMLRPPPYDPFKP